MNDVERFIDRLMADPPSYHRFFSPCPEELLQKLEDEFGEIPAILRTILKKFNGAGLYLSTGPVLSMFRATNFPPLPSLEWHPEWCVDTFTRKWRQAGKDRENDWCFAMTNYGGLLILNHDGFIKEWDTAIQQMIVEKVEFVEWADGVSNEGEFIIKSF